MRNVFDQYDQPENRLTHALATALNSDPKLVRPFLRNVVGVRGPIPRKLEVVEQSLPGDRPLEEGDKRAKGLPDACIHDGESWAVIIESKVSSPLTRGQLERHQSTLKRRGFPDSLLLTITVGEPKVPILPKGTTARTWSQIYAWLRRQEQSTWARDAADYLEIAEARWSGGVYLKEGTLTEFAGIQFGPDNEYNYPEAKRVLRLGMGELRKKSVLAKELKADLSGAGRSAITGKGAGGVWDYIPLHLAKAEEVFTKTPHLTFSLNRDQAEAMLTFPNQLRTELRRNLIDLGEEGFFDVVLEVERNLRRVLKRCPGAVPWFRAVQRHYKTQRSAPNLDARIEFDLRTARPIKKGTGTSRVRTQEQWLRAAFDAFSHKRSNYQIQIGACFPYQTGKSALAKSSGMDVIADSLAACRPILDAAVGR